MEQISGTVFVVDDDQAIRGAIVKLCEAIGLEVLAFEDCSQFLAEYQPRSSGCLLLDIRMPGMSGLQLQQELKNNGFDIPIIFMTGHGDIPMAAEAFKKGALDFIEKPFRSQQLLDQIYHALEIDEKRAIKRQCIDDLQSRLASLTRREQQVLHLVTEGHLNKVIARELGLSIRTVEYHRSKVMEKMGVNSLAHLIKAILMIQGHAA